MRPLSHITALSLTLAMGTVAQASPKQELSLAAGLDSAYDGNVYNSRGPDFVNRVTPHFSYRLIAERGKFESSYDLGYWTYAFGKAGNSLNHRADLGGEWNATRHLTFKLADEFSRAEDPGFLSRLGV